MFKKSIDMKKILMIMTVVLIALSGCKSKAKQQEEHSCSKCLDGKWSIVKVLDVEPSAAFKETAIFEFNQEEGAVQINAGCNIINVGFTQDCEKLTFSEGLSTRMACPDMSLEDACLKALPQVTGVKKAAGVAEMTDSNGNIIITLKKIK